MASSDFSAASAEFERLCQIVARLRAPGGCPWDQEQTNESILPQLIEEAYELYGCLPSSKRLSILNGADHRLSDPSLMTRAVTEAVDWLCQYVPRQ